MVLQKYRMIIIHIVDTLREVVADNKCIRVKPETIPNLEKRVMCAVFLEAILQFYKDPENMTAFETWHTQKGGKANG